MAANARERESTTLALLAGELRGEAARQRISLRDLARKSGMPYPTVQKSLAGRRMIDVAELARLCVALDVQPSILLRRVEEWVALSEDERGDSPQGVVAVE